MMSCVSNTGRVSLMRSIADTSLTTACWSEVVDHRVGDAVAGEAGRPCGRCVIAYQHPRAMGLRGVPVLMSDYVSPRHGSWKRDEL